MQLSKFTCFGVSESFLTILPVYVTDCINKIIPIVSRSVFLAKARPVFKDVSCQRECCLECAFNVNFTLFGGLIVHSLSHYETLSDVCFYVGLTSK